jgi:hypothetical protein
MRRGKIKSFGKVAIKKIGGRIKSLNPKRRRKMTLKQEGVDDIVESAKSAFSLTILLGSVGAGHAKHNPARAKKEREDELSNSRPLSH